MTDHDCRDRWDGGHYDRIGFVALNTDGRTFFLVDPDELTPEVVKAIHSSHHRLEVRVRFIAEHERLTIVEQP